MSSRRKRYAEICWRAEDIKDVRPNWTTKQCNEFLDENEDHIQLAMIEAGGAAIRECLPTKADDSEEDDT
jgi:hypothetical protein